MSDTVYTTAGGRRFHADAACEALCNGRWIAGWVAGDWGGHDGGPLYPLTERDSLLAALDGFTACRGCVPPALAFPLLDDFGHEPVTDIGWYGETETVCARCTELGLWWTTGGSNPRPVHVIWPCTSAVVLGLVSRVKSDGSRCYHGEIVGTGACPGCDNEAAVFQDGVA